MSVPHIDLAPSVHRAVPFQPDPKLERGAAIFETTRGNPDASVETQFRETEPGLAERLERT